MNTKHSQKPVSKYAKKIAQGGSKYWDEMRGVIDQENREYAIRAERDKNRQREIY